MRDTLAPANFWSDRLARQSARIEKFSNHFDKEEPTSKRRRNAGNTLQELLFEQALAEYSAGQPVETAASTMRRSVANVFPEIVELFPAGHDFEIARPSYAKLNRLIAGLVLTKPSAEEATRFFSAVDKFDLFWGEYGGYDQIWCSYLKYFNLPQKVPDTEVHWPIAYKDLWVAIDPEEPPISKSNALKRFVEAWYEAMSSELMAQTERSGDFGENSQFVGYWCIEAAAASVAFNINDAAVRDHVHYPKDWADWARGAS